MFPDQRRDGDAKKTGRHTWMRATSAGSLRCRGPTKHGNRVVDDVLAEETSSTPADRTPARNWAMSRQGPRESPTACARPGQVRQGRATRGSEGKAVRGELGENRVDPGDGRRGPKSGGTGADKDERHARATGRGVRRAVQCRFWGR